MKVVFSDEDKYHEEKNKRREVYLNNCKISEKLWEKYEKDKSTENQRVFFDFLKKVDESYIDWMDNVEFQWEE